MRVITLVLVVLLASLAGGCGFHLRGDAPLPQGLDRVYVATADELSPFAVEIRRALEAAGTTLAPSAGEAATVLRILKDQTGRRVLSVSARNTPQEYDLYYRLEYSIERSGTTVVQPQALELTRNFSFDETRVLAKDREEAILREALAQDLADLVLRRMGSMPAAAAAPAAAKP